MNMSIKVEDIINTFIKCYKDFFLKEKIPLLNPEFPDTFTPSVGAVHLDRILRDKKQYKKKINFAITDVCYRDFDSKRVSEDRLSLFEMCAAFSLNDPSFTIEEDIKKSYEFLTKYLGISKHKLLITYFSGARLLDHNIPANKISLNTWKKLGIKKVVGCKTANFLIGGYTADSQVIQVAGPRDEIFYETKSGNFIEVGTLQYLVREVEYNHFIPLRINPFPTAAFGPERIALCMGEGKSIFEINTLQPLKKIAENKFKNTYRAVLYQKNMFKIVDHLRAVAFLVADGADFSKNHRGDRLKRLLNSAISEAQDSDIDDEDLYKDLISEIIKVYQKRFPDIKKLRNKTDIITERRKFKK